SLLYENQIGIENRLKELGGSGSVMVDAIPLKGTFSGKSRQDVFSQYEKLNVKYLDTYIFQNELGVGVADKWLECMKLCNHRAWMIFDKQESSLLRFGYGDANSYPAKVVSLQTTKGLVLKGDFPKEFNGEHTLSIGRKAGTNRAEGVRLELLLKDGKTVSLEAILPPIIPKLVHWKSELVSTRGPQTRETRWKWDIPEIPKGTNAVLYCYYQGGSPAEQARVTLTAGAHVIDEVTGEEVGQGFRWSALGPQTHIPASSQSMTLPAGKYRTEGQLVTEKNGDWAGSSGLQMMILVKLNEDDFKLDWNPKPE
ncbi:MAG: hypothetical protein R3C11_29890, partial [Planctomycetaceae bacterium]